MNDPYKGPLGIFTHEELEYIREMVMFPTDKTTQSIKDKIDRAITSDPKFRTPNP